MRRQDGGDNKIFLVKHVKTESYSDFSWISDVHI